MPKSLIILILLLIVVASPVLYIVATTPFNLEKVELDKVRDAPALLRLVPSNASDIALAPRSGAVVRAMQNHAVLRDSFSDGALSSPFLPFLLGRSNVVVWRGDGTRGAAARLDAVRSMLLRIYVSTTANGMTIRSSNGATIVATGAGPAADASEVGSWLALASALQGHVLLIETGSSDLGFPPIGRPSITTITFDGDSIRTMSRAASARGTASGDLSRFRLPASALIAASVNDCPKALKSIRRLFPFDVCTLFAHGGLVAIYDIDTRKLIPRLHGVLVVPAAGLPADLLGTSGLALEEHRMVGGIDVVRKRMPGATFEMARRGDELLVGLDKSSLERFLGDVFVDVSARSASAEWVVRVRPADLNRVLASLEDRKEILLLAPDVARTIRDLRDSSAMFAGASSGAAVRTSDGAWDVVEAEVGAK